MEITSLRANNGIIKVINSKDFKETLLYEYTEEETSEIDNVYKTIDFLVSLINDLDLQIGSEDSNFKLNFEIDWGEDYNPQSGEIENKIKSLEKQIKTLKDKLHEIEETEDLLNT